MNKNNYVIKNNYCEIHVHNNKLSNIILIDINDIELCKKYNWYITNNGYACNKRKKDKILLHRYIIKELNKVNIIDHINHDKFDNRKCNLRIVTKSQNAMNTKLSKDNTSGYKGVIWCKDTNKWRARITINGKSIHLGRYDTKLSAYHKRIEAEFKYFGQYANFNLIKNTLGVNI